MYSACAYGQPSIMMLGAALRAVAAGGLGRSCCGTLRIRFGRGGDQSCGSCSRHCAPKARADSPTICVTRLRRAASSSSESAWMRCTPT